MTSFQHLSRAWELQWQDGEKLTDFAGQLKNTIRKAAVHIKNKYKKDNCQYGFLNHGDERESQRLEPKYIPSLHQDNGQPQNSDWHCLQSPTIR